MIPTKGYVFGSSNELLVKATNYKKIINESEYAVVVLNTVGITKFGLGKINRVCYKAEYDAEHHKWTKPYESYTGYLVTDMIFDNILKVDEGYTRVRINGLYGYLDENLDLGIECIYKKAGFFKNGISMVTTVDDSVIFIDKSGSEVTGVSDDIHSAYLTEVLAREQDDELYLKHIG